MAHNKLYRNFIILQEDERGYSTSKDKALSGYAKVEAKGDKCKVSFYAQNLKPEESYSMVLICCKRDTKQLIDLGPLTINEVGKGDTSKEYYINNIAGLGISYEKISGAAICRTKGGETGFVMYGFMNGEESTENWRKFKLIKVDGKRSDSKIDSITKNIQVTKSDTKIIEPVVKETTKSILDSSKIETKVESEIEPKIEPKIELKVEDEVRVETNLLDMEAESSEEEIKDKVNIEPEVLNRQDDKIDTKVDDDEESNIVDEEQNRIEEIVEVLPEQNRNKDKKCDKYEHKECYKEDKKEKDKKCDKCDEEDKKEKDKKYDKCDEEDKKEKDKKYEKCDKEDKKEKDKKCDKCDKEDKKEKEKKYNKCDEEDKKYKQYDKDYSKWKEEKYDKEEIKCIDKKCDKYDDKYEYKQYNESIGWYKEDKKDDKKYSIEEYINKLAEELDDYDEDIDFNIKLDGDFVIYGIIKDKAISGCKWKKFKINKYCCSQLNKSIERQDNSRRIEENTITDSVDFGQYEEEIQKIKNSNDFMIKGKEGKYFEKLAEDFEPYNEKLNDINYCKWYKVDVNSIEDLCNQSNYNKYTLAYYPMLNYYPYINKSNYFLLGYKCNKSGELQYIVYGIPGSKDKNEQPFGGKTGFVTWTNDDTRNQGYWLMFYDYKNSSIVVPMK